jgi:hypothetical protein
MLLATDHMQNASRLVSAVESLCLMHAHTSQEDGSLVDVNLQQPFTLRVE